MELRPEHVLRMTHKEFFMISQESVERIHDDNEREAMSAIMNAVASRGKGKKQQIPTIKELYDRNKSGSMDGEKEAESKLEQYENAQKWLSNFDLSALSDK